jgi:hypothetical protein
MRNNKFALLATLWAKATRMRFAIRHANLTPANPMNSTYPRNRSDYLNNCDRFLSLIFLKQAFKFLEMIIIPSVSISESPELRTQSDDRLIIIPCSIKSDRQLHYLHHHTLMLNVVPKEIEKIDRSNESSQCPNSERHQVAVLPRKNVSSDVIYRYNICSMGPSRKDLHSLHLQTS